jgi:hypothetical protein
VTTHYLKTWPEPFNLSLGGLKPFEVRKDDRDFEAGDLLCLQEWDPYGKAYTGRELMRRVTCVIRTAGPLALPDGLVVLGVEDATLAAEQARLGALLHRVAELLGVKSVFGAIEEEPLLAAAQAVQEAREAQARMIERFCEFEGA